MPKKNSNGKLSEQVSGMANPTIAQALDRFLEDQQLRLKPQTFARYRDVIALLKHSLNSYAYQGLSREESQRLEHAEEQKQAFCDVFGPDQILPNVGEFLGYFMVRKVMAGKALKQAAGTVTKRLARWLAAAGYVSAAEAQPAVKKGTKAARLLPQAEELARQLSVWCQTQPAADYQEYAEDYFTITRIEPGRLWFSAWSARQEIGPVPVPRAISPLAQEGWSLYLELGRTRKGWRILLVGNVYPL